MKVTVLMGGISREREISLRSGERVVEALKKLGYDVTPLDVKEDFFEKIDILKKSDVVFIALHGAFGEDGCI
ncbi:MAG TPA: D-alanine--D-alanine ligase, partial [Thermotoga sp.]|nr:D-alanine--D-alanine ligase [Thermotoga sp.]